MVTINQNVSIADHVSEIWLPDSSRLALNRKTDNMMSSSSFFEVVVSLVKFSYWSKFHVNIITGSGVMTIFVYKRLTRNPEIGNTHV